MSAIWELTNPDGVRASRLYLHDDPERRGTKWMRVVPSAVKVLDLSYVAPL